MASTILVVTVIFAAVAQKLPQTICHKRTWLCPNKTLFPKQEVAWYGRGFANTVHGIPFRGWSTVHLVVC